MATRTNSASRRLSVSGWLRAGNRGAAATLRGWRAGAVRSAAAAAAAPARARRARAAPRHRHRSRAGAGTASSSASASQRSRRALGIGIGRLPGRGSRRQRLQFRGHGETITATGSAVGLQYTGQIDLAPLRCVLQQLHQLRGLAAEPDQLQVVVLDG
ncbi:hypothetical protein G6F59_015998 [Rhizopus arrhizus]|nr:hypothetical protein G6F59_015998 [Rhizopus arrhizus]